MTYNLNGKNIRIPDSDIKEYMESLHLPKDEAIIINNARMHDLRNALLHIVSDGVNILSENTEPTK